MTDAHILAVVEDQFYDVRKRLDMQLKRTARITKDIAELRRTVDLAHDLLKQLVARMH